MNYCGLWTACESLMTRCAESHGLVSCMVWWWIANHREQVSALMSASRAGLWGLRSLPTLGFLGRDVVPHPMWLERLRLSSHFLFFYEFFFFNVPFKSLLYFICYNAVFLSWLCELTFCYFRKYHEGYATVAQEGGIITYLNRQSFERSPSELPWIFCNLIILWGCSPDPSA